jgi:tetratricopeptide (TPR) repeat protein
MSYSEEKFRDHIRKMVKETEVDSDRPLTLDELKELALDMGMVDSEWNDLLVKADESLELAKNHLAVKNFRNAVESAEEATSINPYIRDGNAVLAQSYYQLSILEKNEEYLVKAGDYAKRELIIDPLDATALHVLSAVENQQSEGRYSKKLFKYLAIGGAILVVLFITISFCSRQTTNDDVTNIIRNNGSVNDRNIDLTNLVEEKERVFKEAVQRRNNFLISWFSGQGNSNGANLVENFDFENLAKSESALQRELGAARSKNDLTSEERIQLEGFENRMAVEKKRWIEAITNYNSFLVSNKKEMKNADKIDFPN